MSPLALGLVLAAAVAHSAWNIIAHGVSRAGVPFLWWGALVSTLVWLPAVAVTGIGEGATWNGFLLGAGVSAVFHLVYMLVLQRGYRAGNLTTVYATARGTGPFLSVLAAIALLGERLSGWALCGVALIILGVVALGLVDRGRGAGQGRRLDPAIVFGLLTGVAIAAYTVWDAHALREWSLHPIAFMVGNTAVETLLFSALAWRSRGAMLPFVRVHWRRVLAFGVLSPLSYILALTATTIAPVALVAPLREVSVVLVSLFGAFVLKESHPAGRVAASFVVVGGIALLAV